VKKDAAIGIDPIAKLAACTEHVWEIASSKVTVNSTGG
jgi:hypothetical protein